MNDKLRRPAIPLEYTAENRKIALIHELLIDEHDFLYIRRADGSFASLQDIIMDALGGMIQFKGFVATHAELDAMDTIDMMPGYMYIVRKDEKYLDDIDNTNIEYVIIRDDSTGEKYWECLGNPFKRGIDDNKPIENSTRLLTSGAAWSYLNSRFITEIKWNDTEDTVTYTIGSEDGTGSIKKKEITIGENAHRKVETRANQTKKGYLTATPLAETANTTLMHDTSIWFGPSAGELSFIKGNMAQIHLYDLSQPSNTSTMVDITPTAFTVGKNVVTDFKGGVTIEGDVKFNKGLDLDGDVVIGGTLDVKKTTKLEDKLTITKNGLDVSGATKIVGATNITGNTKIDGTLEVTGDTTLDKKLKIAKQTFNYSTAASKYKNIDITQIDIADVYEYLVYLKKSFREGIDTLNQAFTDTSGSGVNDTGGDKSFTSIANRIKALRPDFLLKKSNGAASEFGAELYNNPDYYPVKGTFHINNDTLQFIYKQWVNNGENPPTQQTTKTLDLLTIGFSNNKVVIEDAGTSGGYYELPIPEINGSEGTGFYNNSNSSQYIITPDSNYHILFNSGEIRYASKTWVIESLGGDAESGHVLSGKTFSSNIAGRNRSGTMKQQSANNKTLTGGSSQTYQAGYYPNAWTVTAQDNTPPALGDLGLYPEDILNTWNDAHIGNAYSGGSGPIGKSLTINVTEQLKGKHVYGLFYVRSSTDEIQNDVGNISITMNVSGGGSRGTCQKDFSSIAPSGKFGLVRGTLPNSTGNSTISFIAGVSNKAKISMLLVAVI